VDLGAGGAFTRRAQGDFRIDRDPVELSRLRAGHEAGAWTWLRQVHGARVVTVREPGEHAGEEADAAVSATPDAVLAVHTADCAAVLLHSRPSGVIGAAHVGWRGLVSGVLERTVEAMAELGATRLGAQVGPHIRARCYEFGAEDLDVVAARYGDGVRDTTAWGTPGLDLLAGIRAALSSVGVEHVGDHGGCTACEPASYFSHRARGDRGRMVATMVRRDIPPDRGPS
jgi:YfiH family protein